MKKLFIYYSQSGNGDSLCELMKAKGFDIIKVETVKPIKKMNFFRILRYGGEAMMKKKRPIKPIDLRLEEYDHVFIGSPIWNDRLATPILALLSEFEFDKEITKFILYSGGGSAKHAEAQLKQTGFKWDPIVLKQPLKYPDEAKEALEHL